MQHFQHLNQHYIIRCIFKKTLKSLHNKRIISADNGLNIIVDEKCTLLKKQYCYIHFLNHQMHIMLYRTLWQCYMRKYKNNMDVIWTAHWKMICKYILWQINITLYWFHLDLKLENCMILNSDFIMNRKDNSVSINRNINIKIIDFGLSEIFNDNSIKDRNILNMIVIIINSDYFI